MEDFAIKVENVSKTFKLPHEKQSSMKSMFINIFRSKRGYEQQKALYNVSFEIKKGEFFGIVGRNGSGKSTLLKLLAGIYSPTSGQVHVRGSLTPFIELGVGFNPELTGRENIYLNGALLGFNRKEMNRMYRDIVKFAELEKFMDQKLKNYSSGMQVRLAFSIAIRSQSDILLLDEVLAVGDAVFQQKCYKYFRQLKKDKRTVIFVSHDSNALLEYCDKGILLDNGKLIATGTIEKVVNAYNEVLKNKEQSDESGIDTQRAKWGTGEASVKGTSITDKTGAAKSVFDDNDPDIVIKVQYQARQDLNEPVYGITITDSAGQRIFTSNTLWKKLSAGTLKKGGNIEVSWVVPNIFNVGEFSVAPAVAGKEPGQMYEWVENAASFKIRKNYSNLSYTNPRHKIIIERQPSAK